MTSTVMLALGLTDFEALDNALRARRASALLVPGEPSPMEAFQADLIDMARRLGFVPPEPGSFWVRVQPGGRNMLCWAASAAATEKDGVPPHQVKPARIESGLSLN